MASENLFMKIDSYTYPRIVEQLVHLWSWDRKALIVTAPYSTLRTLILCSSNCSFSFLHRCFETSLYCPEIILKSLSVAIYVTLEINLSKFLR